MKERPIPFSAPMVRALLAGTKVQTRRVVKGAPDDWTPIGPEVFSPTVIDRHGEEQPGPDAYGAGNEDGSDWFRCPYGQPGDRLWVREAYRFRAVHDHVPPRELSSGPVWYEAQNAVPFHPTEFGKLRPGMFMPRWASRITLEVTGVRVEKLQDITNADALAEGVNVHPDHHSKPPSSIFSPVQAFRDLWESINGPGSWDANPWVWVVEFKREGPAP